MVSSCVALSRKGYLETLCRVFAHLKKHHIAEMVLIHQNQLSTMMTLKEKNEILRV